MMLTLFISNLFSELTINILLFEKRALLGILHISEIKLDVIVAFRYIPLYNDSVPELISAKTEILCVFSFTKLPFLMIFPLKLVVLSVKETELPTSINSISEVFTVS